MKIFNSQFQNLNARFLYKESSDNFEAASTETVETPMQKFAAEVSGNKVESSVNEVNEDVNDALENKIGESRLKRLWNRTKNFFKTKIFGVTEIDYPKYLESNEENHIDEEELLKNRSTGEIKENFLYKTDDINIFKIVFEKLLNRCDIVLRDPKLLETMNRVSKTNFFAVDDHLELSNEEFNEKIKRWIAGQPSLGKEMADLWDEAFIAESMKKDGDFYETQIESLMADKETARPQICWKYSDRRQNAQESIASADRISREG